MPQSTYRKVLLLFLFCLGSVSVFAQWSTTNLSTARSTVAASAGTKAFFAAGTDFTGNATSRLDIYNDATGLWSNLELSEPRAQLAAANLGSKVFFAGGVNNSGAPLDLIEIHDVSNLSWTTGTLSQARYALATTSLGTRVFFAGGFVSVTASDVVDIYNSSSGWTTATLSMPRASLAAAAAGTKVLFAGGYDIDMMTSEQVYSDRVDIYDTGTGNWTTATLSHERGYLSGAAVGTKILFAGGTYSPGIASNVVDIYDASTGTWSTATLSQARSGMAATTLGNKVFFAGGYTDTGNSNVVDIYDNSTGTWSTTTLSVARNFLAATSVGSKALFAGGYASAGITSIVDIYDGSCNPILTVSPPVSMCLGESTVLTVSGGTNYTWSPAAGLNQTTGASVIATPTVTTTYQVVDAGLGACGSITVTVGAPIGFSFVSPSKTICNGSSARLTATGPTSISWSPSTGLSATTGSTVIASPTVTTTYTVSGSNGTGCVITANITVTVDPCNGLTTALLSQKRFDLAAASVGNKALFAGGTVFGSAMEFDPSNYSTAVDIYDNSADTWSAASLSRGRTELAATTVGTKVLFAGGRHEDGPSSIISSDVVDIYDNSTGTWTTATLSEPRHQLAAASTATKAFFAGGFSQQNGFASVTVDIYDNTTGLWSTAALSVPRSNLTATAVGTKVLFAGGSNSGGVSDVVDIYDEGTDTWSTASLSVSRQALTSTSLGGKAYFTGGRMVGDVQSNAVDVYDDGTDTWSTLSVFQARDYLASAATSGKVLFGGGNIGGDVTNTIDTYDTSLETWTTHVLSVDRSNLAATSVGTKVIFAGGLGLNANDGRVVDIYNIGCIDIQVSASADVGICQGASTVLTALGASTYTWSPSTGLSATTGSSVTATPAVTTTYTVIGTDVNGCTGSSSTTVTVYPDIVAVTPSLAICLGGSGTLTATGADTYTWSPSTGLSATTGSSVLANPTTTTTYTVTGFFGPGCSGDAAVTVTVNPLPTITVSPASPTSCSGSFIDLFASGAATYSWSPTTGLSATTGDHVAAGPLGANITYTVTGTSAGGCSNTANAVITVNPTPSKPVITVTPSGSDAFILESSATSGNQWYRNGVVVPNATNQTIVVNTANQGVFTVVTTQSGCASPASDEENVIVTGLENQSGNEVLLIYPNPATESVQVNWSPVEPDQAINVNILEPSGRSVILQQLPPQGGHIDLRNLSPGFYLLQASLGGRTRIQRFVKK